MYYCTSELEQNIKNKFLDRKVLSYLSNIACIIILYCNICEQKLIDLYNLFRSIWSLSVLFYFCFRFFLTTILKTINPFTETLIYNEINIRIQEIHFHVTSLKIKQIWTIIDTNSLESVCIPITITIKLDIILSKAIGKQPSIKIPKSRKSLSPPLNSSQPPGETSSKNKRSKSN